MTATLALREVPWQSRITVARSVTRVPLVREGLRTGEHVKAWKLFYALLLFSGNDDANQLAISSAGSVHAFLRRDERRGARARAPRHALHEPERDPRPRQLLDAVGPRGPHPVRLPQPALQPARADEARSRCAGSAPTNSKIYVNNNFLLHLYTGANGVKTGYTHESGWCLVASATKHGRRLIAVVLDSPNMYADARRLLNLGFSHTRTATVPAAASGAALRGRRGEVRMRLPSLATGTDLAVDLGTANTVVFRRGEGIVLFEPSVVAMDQQTGQVYAVGEKARQMLGRTPATIVATRPLRHGVIADFETTEQMLGQFIRLVGGSGLRRAVIVCVPSGLTQVERDAVVEATLSAGAREAHLIEEAMAGAIGAELPVEDAVASLVVDVGGGTSEMAVIALGGIVVSTSLPVGGYDLDDAIVRFVQDQHRLLVGHEQAEKVKLEIGSALEGHAAVAEAEVAGRYMSTGMLARITLGEDDVRQALERPLSRIVSALKELLEQTPAQLASDIADRGITLVGGGALLPGFGELIHRETGLPVSRDPEPLTTVARGAGAALAELDTLRRSQRRQRSRRGRR